MSLGTTFKPQAASSAQACSMPLSLKRVIVELHPYFLG
jgi:hypothetical protein